MPETPERPKFRVRLNRTITGDWPIGHRLVAPPGEYDATANQYGAIAVILPDGTELGVKPGEFEFVDPACKLLWECLRNISRAGNAELVRERAAVWRIVIQLPSSLDGSSMLLGAGVLRKGIMDALTARQSGFQPGAPRYYPEEEGDG